MRRLVLGSLLLTLPLCGASALAQTVESSFQEQTFDALQGSKQGSECKVVFRAAELSLCNEVIVPRQASPDYRYRDREHAGRFTDHRFIIGWREQGVTRWKHMTIVFRNTETAQRFNTVFAAWADRMPQE